MSSTIYALFGDRTAAHSAADELRGGATEVVVHDRPVNGIDESLDLADDGHLQTLSFGETDATPALLRGAIIGILVGALTGWILGLAFEMGGLGMGLAGAALGFLTGMLGGFLSGSALPNRELAKFHRALKKGGVLATFTAHDATATDRVIEVAKRHGARIRRKHAV